MGSTHGLSEDSENQSPWCILGLGNPGSAYVDTRHNIGFMALESLAESYGLKLKPSPYFKKVIMAYGELPPPESAQNQGPLPVYLIEPLTYMNLSGQVLPPLMAQYGFTKEKILVLYDDIAIPFGKIRVRSKGSSGGHNGMKSIIECLGRFEGFPRIRIGVGGPDGNTDLKEHVLEPFSSEEKKVLPGILEGAVSATLTYLFLGSDAAMQQVNGATYG